MAAFSFRRPKFVKLAEMSPRAFQSNRTASSPTEYDRLVFGSWRVIQVPRRTPGKSRKTRRSHAKRTISSLARLNPAARLVSGRTHLNDAYSKAMQGSVIYSNSGESPSRVARASTQENSNFLQEPRRLFVQFYSPKRITRQRAKPELIL
jgi:hypothetical protein